MKNVIYKIQSNASGKIYVGSAVNSSKRKSVHFRLLRQGKHHNAILQNHYNKYGVDDLNFIILEKDIEANVLIQKEQFYIDNLKPEFNICKIAGSVLGRVHSKETKDKIRKSLIGKKHTEERKINMSIANTGKSKTPFTEEHKKNMSIGMLGRTKKPQTKEHIAKRVAYLIGNKFLLGKACRNIPIVQLKDGFIISEFKSIREAARIVGTTESNICHSLNGRTKKAKGYEWKYKK